MLLSKSSKENISGFDTEKKVIEAHVQTIKNEIVVIILGKNEKETLDLNRSKELKSQVKTFKKVITDEPIFWNDTLKLTQKGSFILTL